MQSSAVNSGYSMVLCEVFRCILWDACGGCGLKKALECVFGVSDSLGNVFGMSLGTSFPALPSPPRPLPHSMPLGTHRICVLGVSVLVLLAL